MTLVEPSWDQARASAAALAVACLLALAALHVWRRPLPEVLREELMDPIGASNTWRWHGYENSWVMLDGQRLNPLDSSNIDWGLVPLEAVDRIEVMSGAASVLYGDNAVGGVINIISKSGTNAFH